MRRSLLSISIAVICLIAGGCRSVGRVGSVAWLKGFGAGAGADKKDDEVPFQAKRKSKPPRDNADDASRYASANSHDAKTLQYIQHELRDAKPEERAVLMEALKKLQPSDVRIVLGRRRLEINRRQMARDGQFPEAERVADNRDARSGRDSAAPPRERRTVAGNRRASFEDSREGSAGFGVKPWEGTRSTAGDVRREAWETGGRSRDSWGRGEANARRPFVDQRSQAAYDSRETERRDGPGGRYGDNSRTGGPAIYPGDDYRSRRAPGATPPDAVAYGRERRGTLENSSRREDRSRIPVPPGRRNSEAADDFRRADSRHGSDPGRDRPGRAAAELVGHRKWDGPGSSGFDSQRLQKPVPEPRNDSRYRDRMGTTANRLPEFPQEWHDTLQRLIATTDSIASRDGSGLTESEQHEHIRRQVFLRMMYLMSGRPQQAIQAIKDIDRTDQKFWQDTFFGLANYLDPELGRDPSVRSARTSAAFTKAAEGLQEKANLKIDTLAFCSEITNFGNYKTFPTNEFRRGDPVLVYAEISNFKSEVGPNNMLRTVLKSEIELSRVGATENSVIAKLNFKPTVDVCHNRRRDYFHSYEIEIPKDAGIGPHVLKLIVTDEQGKKVATDTINFTIK